MFSSNTYATRRDRLIALVKSGLILIPGNTDSPMNYRANIYRFRQDSTFLYFFGLDEPGLTGVIDADSGESMLFGEDPTMEDTIWIGSFEPLQQKAERCGISNTGSPEKLNEKVAQAVAEGRIIHILPPYRAEQQMQIAALIGSEPKASQVLINACVTLRSVKEACELAELEKAMEVAYLIHTTAMHMAKPGVYESEIAGTMEGLTLKYGAGISFPIILSKNGQILHNHHHHNLLAENDLVVVDAGFESYRHYATDNTRTIPVGGRFTQKQKEIYDIVLAANNAVLENAKPGVLFRDMHFLAATVITDGLKQLGLMKGNTAEAVASGAHALFFPHGLGHMLGLDVHDMENYGETFVGYNHEVKRSEQFGTAYLRMARRLEPGFVVTNEPGIYFIPALIDQWQAAGTNSDFINFDKLTDYRSFGGVRLEDTLEITSHGARVMGKRIPITVEEVEREMA